MQSRALPIMPAPPDGHAAGSNARAGVKRMPIVPSYTGTRSSSAIRRGTPGALT